MSTEPTVVIDDYKIRPLLIGDRAYLAMLGLRNHFLIIWIYPKNRKNLTGFYPQQGCSSTFYWDFKGKMEVSSKLSWPKYRKPIERYHKLLCIAQHLPDERRFLYQQRWCFTAYFTTREGENDSLKKGVSCIYQYVRGHPDGLCINADKWANKTLTSLQSF